MAQKGQKIYLMVVSESPGMQKKDWLSQMPELRIIADLEPVFIFDQPSVNITPEVWLKLAREIHQRLDSAGGFVILHGVDNLLFTSSALSFLLQNLTKPIVFTGTQFGSLQSRRVEMRANLINASQTTHFNFTEVCLMFGNRLLRANQARQSLEKSLNVFTAPLNAVLGRIDFSIRIFDKLALNNKGKTKLFDQLSDQVEIIRITPVLNLKILAKRLVDREGIIVNAKYYQELPRDLMFLFEKITPDLPVVIWTNRIQALPIAPKNIILINNLTWETTVTKFMWAVGQTTNAQKVKELMLKDVAGEIIDN